MASSSSRYTTEEAVERDAAAASGLIEQLRSQVHTLMNMAVARSGAPGITKDKVDMFNAQMDLQSLAPLRAITFKLRSEARNLELGYAAVTANPTRKRIDFHEDQMDRLKAMSTWRAEAEPGAAMLWKKFAPYALESGEKKLKRANEFSFTNLKKMFPGSLSSVKLLYDISVCDVPIGMAICVESTRDRDDSRVNGFVEPVFVAMVYFSLEFCGSAWDSPVSISEVVLMSYSEALLSKPPRQSKYLVLQKATNQARTVVAQLSRDSTQIIAFRKWLLRYSTLYTCPCTVCNCILTMEGGVMMPPVVRRLNESSVYHEGCRPLHL